MSFQKLENLEDIAKKKGTKKIVVAVAQDEDVLKALQKAQQTSLVIPVLVGDKHLIEKSAQKAAFDISNIEIIDEPDAVAACNRAVGLITEKNIPVLMKGLVSTSTLLKAFLNKENNLTKGNLLSHVALFESPYYHKVFCVTDAAMNIQPGLEEKISIITNAVNLYHQLGIQMPKLAILAAVETVNPKMEATLHASILREMNEKGQIEGCIIDGPFALDNAVSKEAAKHKGIISKVAGDADILVVPDLNSGNILYKALCFMGGAVSAALVTGADIPIVLTSRADSDRSKYLSIVLAAALK